MDMKKVMGMRMRERAGREDKTAINEKEGERREDKYSKQN